MVCLVQWCSYHCVKQKYNINNQFCITVIRHVNMQIIGTVYKNINISRSLVLTVLPAHPGSNQTSFPAHALKLLTGQQ